MATAEPNHLRRSIAFINWAHAIDHYVMLIFPTVVIGLEIVYGRSYAELIALGTPSGSVTAFRHHREWII